MLCGPTTLVHHLSLMLFLDKSQVSVKWISKKGKKTHPSENGQAQGLG